MVYIVINSSILGIHGKKPLNYVKGKSIFFTFLRWFSNIYFYFHLSFHDLLISKLFLKSDTILSCIICSIRGKNLSKKAFYWRLKLTIRVDSLASEKVEWVKSNFSERKSSILVEGPLDECCSICVCLKVGNFFQLIVIQFLFLLCV